MKNRLVDELKPIVTSYCDYIYPTRIVIEQESWVPVKILAKKLKVSKNTVLERIRRGQYQAKTLFGLILIKEERIANNEPEASREIGDRL